ncbi:MAG: hypothetical protein ABSB99_11255 [Acidimicrobiales bacterium]
MTRTPDRTPDAVAPSEPVFITPPLHPPAAGARAGRGGAGGGGAGGAGNGARGAAPFRRRHRVALIVTAVVVTVLAGGAGAFIYEWNHTGPHELSSATAYQRFRSGATGRVMDPGQLRPHEGVYAYQGAAAEHVSFPPKSQVEGPTIPGTVTYRPDGCWILRLDYSDSHWQSSTYCPRNGDLVEVGRVGWYRWNFVAFVIADTATYTCDQQEVAIPAVLHIRTQYSFSCKGTNNPINTGVVTMVGTNEYVGPQTLKIAGTEVVTLHFHEVAHFSGGQTGYNIADTWFSTVDGLPVRGTWKTAVTSPTALGSSTLTGTGNFTLSSLVPRL